MLRTLPANKTNDSDMTSTLPNSRHQHVAITNDVGPGGERSMSGHVFGLSVGHLEVVVDGVDDTVDAAAIGIVNGRSVGRGW
jgi:hypothetical protein